MRVARGGRGLQLNEAMEDELAAKIYSSFSFLDYRCRAKVQRVCLARLQLPILRRSRGHSLVPYVQGTDRALCGAQEGCG